ncbi:PP2C family protein-serine/threonine phosphatase [Streptantibioticus ferralitis]|uniref:PP2C family protein-serine/threonine phosphatase n=1 Tax=Streptantibioticus ferralitis TaxID=236510 RepID=A0ABT5YVW0_9ACTN|nr:PP2C family protein-serine/threonine phosphatase [Streptantibioticus ferralitis]MDF2255742.1 PP2C family protein-serine/threonine phosphatase [Streptantibioticus ferralitis]
MADVVVAQPQLPPVRLSARARALVGAAYLLVGAAIVVDLLTGPGSTFSPVLAAVPVLAAIGTRRTAIPLLAGLVSVLGVAFLGMANSGVSMVVHATAAATVLAVTFISTASVALVAARERELAQVRSVAAAAQQALLRPVPRRLGALRIAVRYVAAAAEARIGGDLYEVLSTPYGARMLLGDVRGKGLAAVEAAVDVLGVFRDAAQTEGDLSAVASRLDGALARRPGSEEFVTAVLVSVPDQGPTSVLNCGHPPPLLRNAAGGTEELDPPRYAPPLALLSMVGSTYTASTIGFGPGELLLLYTDGVSEARDASDRFYPLLERVAGMRADDPEALLDELIADVRAYTGGGLNDDAALLAVRYDAPATAGGSLV